MVKTRSQRQANKFCGCVKKVRKTVRLRSGRGAAAKESAAIAICTKSVLQTRGRTLKRVRCKPARGGPKLETQKLLSGQ